MRPIACENVQQVLEEYHAGELNAKETKAIEAHVSSCRHCQHEIALAQEIDAALTDLPKPEPPPELFAHVAAYVRAHPHASRFGGLKRWFSLRPLTIGFASALLIAFAVFAVYQRHQQIQVERASRELHFALNTVRYAMRQTEVAIDTSIPDDVIANTPHKALLQTSEKLKPASQALRQSLNILTIFNAKEQDKS